MVKSQFTGLIRRDNGEIASATFPSVISASRRTDIPAFYAGWFFERLNKGYCAWINPFNGKRSFISFENTEFIVFWSKNPRPLLGNDYLDYLKERGIGCHIQFTLNDYECEKLEPGLPPLDERLDTFVQLAEMLGRNALTWRFDPLFLAPEIDIAELLAKIEYIGNRLCGVAEKLVFSFAQILDYKKVKSRLDRQGIAYINWNREQKLEFAKKLVKLKLQKGWQISLAGCGDIEPVQGVLQNRCIDAKFMAMGGGLSPRMLEYLKAKKYAPELRLFGAMADLPENVMDAGIPGLVEIPLDTGQRSICHCVKSADIGEYGTCPHLCEYCYANSSAEIALQNYQRHLENQFTETIKGFCE